MWGRSKNIRAPRITTLVGHDTEIIGDVNFDGGLHVDGRIQGNVLSNEGTGSVFTLSEGAMVEGEVRVDNIILNGTVLGDVYASGRIELASQARISGNLYYGVIQMASGAAVNGNLVCTAETVSDEAIYETDTPHTA